MPTQSTNNDERTVVPQQNQADSVPTVIIDKHPSENALPVGSQLKEFEITDIIGWGGFGIVYLAKDHSLQRQVALKEYMPSTLAKRENNTTVVIKSELHRETFHAGLRSFVNEARLLAKFDHPSLVKVYQFWESNGTAYMVMPFYQGVTLKEKLKAMDHPPEETWLKFILSHLTDALSIIHEDHCFHRDISPDNILILTENGRPLLLDFGAARRVISDMTQSLTVILKPGYAPVEQYGEIATLTQGPWTDIYALAAVIYFSITGQTPTASVSRMVSDTLTPLDEIAEGRYSHAFLTSIDQALSIKPQDRPQNIAEFRALLNLSEHRQAITANEETIAYANNEPNVKPILFRSKRTIVFFAAAVITLITVIGLAIIIPPSDDTEKQLTNKERILPNDSFAGKKVPFEPINALNDIFDHRDLEHAVTVSVGKAKVRIGIDPLNFQIRSARPGYVYLLMVGSNRTDFFLLFPNAVDQENYIESGGKLNLPRASWKMKADGPPGTNQFVAIVSKNPRDFTEAGITNIDPFAEFPFKLAAQLQQAHTGPYPLFAGRAVCPSYLQEKCPESYGATVFSIEEIDGYN